MKSLVEDMTEDQLLEVLEDALSARVIEELRQTMGRYQFTHALIQETLVDEITTTRRVRLHAKIAKVLETLYGDNADHHASELAHHLAEAGGVTGSDKLVFYYCWPANRHWRTTLGRRPRPASSRDYRPRE